MSTLDARADDHRVRATAVAAAALRADTDAATKAARRRRDTIAYACLALGSVLYVFAIWAQAYLDTHGARRPAGDLVGQSHHHWRMRTALVFLVWSVLGGLTLPFGIIGWLVLIPAYAWYLYRVVKGAVYFGLGRPIGVMNALAHAGRPAMR